MIIRIVIKIFIITATIIVRMLYIIPTINVVVIINIYMTDDTDG